jgi:hypothetical protein
LFAAPADSGWYRLYRITRGDGPGANPDYAEWPAEWGAPIDHQENPRLYGDQTLWTVFNNLDPTAPSLPSLVRLEQNYPIPFNPMTPIEYHLPEPGNVSPAVFDVLGREVAELASGLHQPGVYSTRWDATSLAGGVYYARLTVTGELGRTLYAKAIKLLLVK